MINYSKVVAEQRSFFESGATRSIAFRKEQLRKLRDALKANEEALYDAIYADFRKSEFDTYTTELGLIYREIKESIRKVGKRSKRKRVRTNFINFPAKSYIIPQPLGVSLIIGAWNYPYLLSLSPAVAAIAAGCTVILKPSELPTKTSAIIHKVINTTFESSFFTVIEGSVEETTALLKEKYDKIFFTGSTVIGRIVYQAAAKHLTPVTLEMGGKSPTFITKSAHLKMTAKRLVWGKFLNAGQTCIAPDYLLVHEDIKEEFLSVLIDEIQASDFSIENGNYVRIINNRHMERLLALLDSELVYHGGNYDRETLYIEPTILTKVTMQHPVMKEEIFGPILPVFSYSSLDEAIAEVKRLPQPLSCYVFTSDSTERNKILREISFGGGAVNETVMHISNNHLPFGGVGESGIGAYHGEEGFKAFSHYKGILDKPTWMELNLKYSPQTKKKLSLIKRFLSL